MTDDPAEYKQFIQEKRRGVEEMSSDMTFHDDEELDPNAEYQIMNIFLETLVNLHDELENPSVNILPGILSNLVEIGTGMNVTPELIQRHLPGSPLLPCCFIFMTHAFEDSPLGRILSGSISEFLDFMYMLTSRVVFRYFLESDDDYIRTVNWLLVCIERDPTQCTQALPVLRNLADDTKLLDDGFSGMMEICVFQRLAAMFELPLEYHECILYIIKKFLSLLQRVDLRRFLEIADCIMNFGIRCEPPCPNLHAAYADVLSEMIMRCPDVCSIIDKHDFFKMMFRYIDCCEKACSYALRFLCLVLCHMNSLDPIDIHDLLDMDKLKAFLSNDVETEKIEMMLMFTAQYLVIYRQTALNKLIDSGIIQQMVMAAKTLTFQLRKKGVIFLTCCVNLSPLETTVELWRAGILDVFICSIDANEDEVFTEAVLDALIKIMNDLWACGGWSAFEESFDACDALDVLNTLEVCHEKRDICLKTFLDRLPFGSACSIFPSEDSSDGEIPVPEIVLRIEEE